jgi:hypothetical protein
MTCLFLRDNCLASSKHVKVVPALLDGLKDRIRHAEALTVVLPASDTHNATDPVDLPAFPQLQSLHLVPSSGYEGNRESWLVTEFVNKPRDRLPKLWHLSISGNLLSSLTLPVGLTSMTVIPTAGCSLDPVSHFTQLTSLRCDNRRGVGFRAPEVAKLTRLAHVDFCMVKEIIDGDDFSLRVGKYRKFVQKRLGTLKSGDILHTLKRLITLSCSTSCRTR